MDTKYLTAAEVGRMVGLHPETVLRAYRAGELAGYAVNPRVLRFTEAGVDEWMGSGRRDRKERQHAPVGELRPSSRRKRKPRT